MILRRDDKTPAFCLVYLFGVHFVFFRTHSQVLSLKGTIETTQPLTLTQTPPSPCLYIIVLKRECLRGNLWALSEEFRAIDVQRVAEEH